MVNHPRTPVSNTSTSKVTDPRCDPDPVNTFYKYQQAHTFQAHPSRFELGQLIIRVNRPANHDPSQAPSVVNRPAVAGFNPDMLDLQLLEQWIKEEDEVEGSIRIATSRDGNNGKTDSSQQAVHRSGSWPLVPVDHS
ncbi:hypothetical protein KEM48_000112 [Puccinia striiformis f. sp. tritici PST-130]|nr:hypothetical protein KEM48_000112 [Puccinia striiformis f. sp. tritici PST-130]